MPLPTYGNLFSQLANNPNVRKKTPADGTYGGAASGANVSPVYQSTPSYTPNPAIQLSGSYTPDYGALIQADPGYLATQNTGALTLDQAAAQRRQAMKTLVMQYGGLPSSAQDVYGDLDQPTLDLAKGNQFSDISNLNRNTADSVEAYKRALAARGVLNSGELGYGLNRADLARGQQEYDLGNQFANAYQGSVNRYMGVVNQQKQAEADSIGRAAQNVYGNPSNRPSDAVMANYLEGSHEKYGEPVYRGPDGRLYRADGSPFTGSETAPQPSQDIPSAVAYGAGQVGGQVGNVTGAVSSGAGQVGQQAPSLWSGSNAVTSGVSQVGRQLASAFTPTTPYGNVYQRRKQALV